MLEGFSLTLRKQKIIIMKIKNELSENTLYPLDNAPKP